MYGISKIKEALPQRYPFLLVDRVIQHEYNKSVTTIKNITFNEFWSVGHFDYKPIYPGVLMIETMAQTGGLIFHNFDDNKNNLEGKDGLLVGVNKTKFLKRVEPGDRIITVGQKVINLGDMAKVYCEMFVDDCKVAQGELSYLVN
ncbi:beta-hydroxyacyl-ACP dehydratase FabZ [Paenibacillus anaericanus]|uniref:3-hydroxyacyl-[acyl-carrier-protein] dehydratase n=1 Tax=Paenibacillus anaericanus TaxID=170367 RepID=A0A433Y3Y2_9BACL|nr:3-hydroxyacyl-ACP dehydratase FabZ [Paenibacillus anaericanus]MDQ0089665.1 beta-hydroxyacyl-ACP dehydratase FabZ [Paenibacillus anaericanus]RUT42932.1 3-hydroxyacyl-ACP dehydratase FabZ [Paenibacillus anaericanus]